MAHFTWRDTKRESDDQVMSNWRVVTSVVLLSGYIVYQGELVMKVVN